MVDFKVPCVLFVVVKRKLLFSVDTFLHVYIWHCISKKVTVCVCVNLSCINMLHTVVLRNNNVIPKRSLEIVIQPIQRFHQFVFHFGHCIYQCSATKLAYVIGIYIPVYTTAVPLSILSVSLTDAYLIAFFRPPTYRPPSTLKHFLPTQALPNPNCVYLTWCINLYHCILSASYDRYFVQECG